ncbi:hypothetical protein [Nitratifractor sp.]|uniref:hypothetical protein n=1 Tax=Nitratifractor sp. TaxID=2268144 RepID=UPI0025F4628B|nr:hypothetical protein [Nitratifractor sp.]
MKQKVVLSIAAAMFMTAGSANAFGFSGNGNGSVGSVNGGFDWGAGEDGFHICVYGNTPMVTGSAAVGINQDVSGCANDQFDFTSVVHGGFAKDSAHADSPNMKPGQDDETQDGFWYREGPFSAPVAYGDLNNDGKRFADMPDAYPAWTWGHPEADPFVSPGGAGDNLGGAAGIGSTGFTTGVNVDDDGIFYPYNFLQFSNKINTSVGTYSSDVSWNVKIYDKDGDKVYDHTFANTLYYWETINFQRDSMGIICPRQSVKEGETVNDVEYAQNVHDNLFSRWPVYGLDINFVSDGGTDTRACSDAVTLKNKEMTDTFSTGPVWNKKTYKVTLDGPYIYDSTVDGCAAENEKGLPDTDGAWDAKCFKKVDTVWIEENSVSQAFMRVKVSEEKKGWF